MKACKTCFLARHKLWFIRFKYTFYINITSKYYYYVLWSELKRALWISILCPPRYYIPGNWQLTLSCYLLFSWVHFVWHIVSVSTVFFKSRIYIFHDIILSSIPSNFQPGTYFWPHTTCTLVYSTLTSAPPTCVLWSIVEKIPSNFQVKNEILLK